MNYPFFSVVIPTLNEEKNLPILLKSLTKQTDKDYEVTVIDSGSTDKTKTVAESFKSKIPCFRFVEHKCRNVSAARNFGASLSRGKFLIFFDADVEIESKFFKKIKEKISQYDLDALTVWNRAKKNKFTGRFILGLLNLSMTLSQKLKPAANGPCIVIKRDIFEKVKGFDERIVFGEDFDLIQRAHRSKAKFAVFPEPILFVSTRRFEKEGLFVSLFKSIKAILYQQIFGPIRKPIFEYEMGGQYYK